MRWSLLILSIFSANSKLRLRLYSEWLVIIQTVDSLGHIFGGGD